MAHIEQEITKLSSKGVINTTKVEEGQIISNIFLRPKKDDTRRLILNLKAFNLVGWSIIILKWIHSKQSSS
jgi:hypothetical protein